MSKDFEWSIIGAGPAGIAAVGKLLDNGIQAQDILWIDPYFQVGDFGRLWANVSSNTKVELFTRFLTDCQAFNYQTDGCALSALDPKTTCDLSYMAKPLQTISDALYHKVHSEKLYAKSITLKNRRWHIKNDNTEFKAKNLILANGSTPSSLNYPEIDAIALEVAMDKQKLASAISSQDTIAVFGSSHSSIIIVRYLVELGIKKIINFYQSPCRYALDMGDWILFDDSGLKGTTADWAHQYIDGEWPQNLVRYHSNEDNVLHYLPKCDKAIYATGFKRRSNIVIENYESADYNPNTGIIAPGLFGFGIAYPEMRYNQMGIMECRVGLWKFMDYLNRVLPIWLRYSP